MQETFQPNSLSISRAYLNICDCALHNSSLSRLFDLIFILFFLLQSDKKMLVEKIKKRIGKEYFLVPFLRFFYYYSVFFFKLLGVHFVPVHFF